MSEQLDSLFLDLPSALVEEVLARTREVGDQLLKTFHEHRNIRSVQRDQLTDARLLNHESNLEHTKIPSSCGVDGASVIERLLGNDLVAAAAVAMEGLTPPTENRFWPEPRHQVYIDTESHDMNTGILVAALMISMELDLASQAPHEVIFLDGSLSSPSIHISKALNAVHQSPDLLLSRLLIDRLAPFLVNYRTILKNKRSDKYWVGCPKYTTQFQISQRMGWPRGEDDRALMTRLLLPGEYIISVSEKKKNPRFLSQISRMILVLEDMGIRTVTNDQLEEVMIYLDEVRYVYYRPSAWFPALCLEVSPAITQSPARLASVLQGVKHQCGQSTIMEPYPLYLADRMAKSLSKGIPTLRQVTGQWIAEQYEGEVSEVLPFFHAYRTETGR